MEGQTATNPQTGEKIVFRNGAWQPVGGAAPQAPGIIQGRQKQPTAIQIEDQQIQRARLGIDQDKNARDAELDALRLQNETLKLQEAQAAASKRAQGQQDLGKARSELQAVIDAATKAKELSNSGWFATGFGADTVKGIGGTSAANVEGQLDIIGSNTAFDRLQKMREESPTGGALGSITERELALLQSTVASLKQGQSDEEFQRQMDIIIQRYQDALTKLPQEEAGDTGVAGSAQAGGAPPQNNGPAPTTRQTGATDSFVTEDDKRRASQLQAAFNQGASAQQMNQLATQLGVQPFAPDELRRIIQARQQGQQVQIAPRATGERSVTDNLIATVADSPFGAYAVGAANALTLGGLDEVAGLVGGRAAGESAQFAKDYLRENNPVSSLAGEVAGTAMGAVGLSRFAPGAASMLATPGGQTAAGATYGFLDNNENRLLGGLTGGLVGRYAPKAIDAAVASAPVQKLGQYGNALLQRLPANQTNALAKQEVSQNADVIQAAQAEGLTLRQPDARPSLRDAYGGAEAGAKSGPQIQRALAEDNQQIAGRVQQVAGQGSPKEGYALGETVQQAVGNRKEAMRDEASALFRRVGLQAPNFKATPDNVARTIDDKIAGIQATTPDGNEAQIAFLGKIKSNFEKTGVSVESLQANRDLVRSQMKQDNLSYSPKEVEMLEVIDQAAIDLENGLRNSGNGAALSTLQNANRKWREYSDFKKQVVRTISGNNNSPVSPEQAATRLLSMVKKGGDSDKFARIFNTMSNDEKNDFRALIAEQLGSNTKGDFSLDFLAKNLTAKKTNLKTLREVFGPDGFRSLMNIQKVARAKVDATSGFNRSNTARAQNNEPAGLKDLIMRAFGAGGGFTVGGIGGAVAGAAAPSLISSLGQKRAARMLLDTDFSKWLANMPNARNPNAINAYFKKLDKIAPQGSVISADIILFKDYLRQAASPGQLAASEQQGDVGPIPPQ